MKHVSGTWFAALAGVDAAQLGVPSAKEVGTWVVLYRDERDAQRAGRYEAWERVLGGWLERGEAVPHDVARASLGEKSEVQPVTIDVTAAEVDAEGLSDAVRRGKRSVRRDVLVRMACEVTGVAPRRSGKLPRKARRRLVELRAMVDETNGVLVLAHTA
jgi:hypothetical protein